MVLVIFAMLEFIFCLQSCYLTVIIVMLISTGFRRLVMAYANLPPGVPKIMRRRCLVCAQTPLIMLNAV